MLTLELRWFVPQAIGVRELEAFAGDGRVEARTDSYLLDTGEELGVKRRGAAGRLEHKRRLAQTPVTVEHPSGRLGGLAERWIKHWPERPSWPGDPGWVAITKRRALRKVGACRAELTLVTDPLAREYLSLALEIAKPHAIDSLVRDAAALLSSHAWLATTLAEAASFGYPAWIERERARWESNPQSTS